MAEIKNKEITVREAAARSLSACFRHGKYSNLEISSALEKYKFEGADRGLFTRLVYGVTERLVTLDYIIGQLSSRPLEKIDADTLNILRLGVYQLLFMDRIPDHAAVSETVAISPKSSKGFVNALLREFIRRNKQYELPSKADVEDHLSIKYSCPAGLCRFFLSVFDRETAEKVISGTLRETPVTIRVNTIKANAEEIVSEVFPEGKISELSDDLIEVKALGAPFSPDGRYFVQDGASRLTVKMLDPKPGETVIDTCAAPGGKSFSIAIDMKNEGEVYSFDLHKNKVSLITKGAENLGLTCIKAFPRDATDPDPRLLGKADRVLCDAPCSGLGVIAKKPDIKYKSISDIERLPSVQLRVLTGASKYVKKGGVLVYSTCTVSPLENEEVVKKFLLENPEFSLVPAELGANLTAEDGMMTFYPHIHGTDGFFAAKMVKNK